MKNKLVKMGTALFSISLLIGTMSTTAMACTSKSSTKTTTTTSSSTSLYSHIDVRVDATIEISQYVDGTLKKDTISGKVSNVTVKLDGKDVEMQKGTTVDENSDGKQYEYKSVAGHTSSATKLSFGEDSTVEVCGDFTYTANGTTSTVTFDKSMLATKSSNVCGGSRNCYGYDLVITSSEIQKCVNKSIINIQKVWDDKGMESKRPSSVKMDIYQNESVIKTVEVTSENDWTVSVADLPNGSYDEKDNWTAYTYTVKEQDINGYKASDAVYNSCKNIFVITNTYVETEDQEEVDDEDVPLEPSVTEAATQTEGPVATASTSEDTDNQEVSEAPTTTDTAATASADTTLTMEDDSNQPKTGDESNPVLFIVIGALAIVGMIAFFVISKLKK